VEDFTLCSAVSATAFYPCKELRPSAPQPPSWYTPTAPNELQGRLFGLLLQVAIEELFRELDALELEELHVLLHQSVERHPDGPRLRERLGIFNRRRVLQVAGVQQLVAFRHLQLVGVVI